MHRKKKSGLPLVKKEAYLANSQAEYSQAGNPNKDTGKKKMECEKYQQPLGKQDVRDQAVSLTTKYRIKRGLN